MLCIKKYFFFDLICYDFYSVDALTKVNIIKRKYFIHLKKKFLAQTRLSRATKIPDRAEPSHEKFWLKPSQAELT